MIPGVVASPELRRRGLDRNCTPELHTVLAAWLRFPPSDVRETFCRSVSKLQSQIHPAPIDTPDCFVLHVPRLTSLSLFFSSSPASDQPPWLPQYQTLRPRSQALRPARSPQQRSSRRNQQWHESWAQVLELYWLPGGS